ncbi:DUF4224 domain-containing protein, partial [bacterium]|nr:DUF4224 domain-containing protein [bacterium]
MQDSVLTQEELQALTGLVKPSAQCKWLDRSGIGYF